MDIRTIRVKSFAEVRFVPGEMIGINYEETAEVLKVVHPQYYKGGFLAKFQDEHGNESQVFRATGEQWI